MIEKRELALHKLRPTAAPGMKPLRIHHEADNADEAMLLLGLISIDPTQTGYFENKPKIETWAAQAALSRPGRPNGRRPRLVDVNAIVHEPGALRWPGGERE
jgi:hypothetical protein